MSDDVSQRSVLIHDAAEILGVSRRTIYYRIRDGRLQTVRTRGGSQRVLLASIEALLRAEWAARMGRRGVPSAGAASQSPSR